MLLIVASKSKSNPSMIEEPNGRGEVLPDIFGPKIDQRLIAAVTAADELEKPPSA